jgi:hypothetical protein
MMAESRNSGANKGTIDRQWCGKLVSTAMSKPNNRGILGSGVLYVVRMEVI